MRAELWPGESGTGIAVGYRFEGPSLWSEPEDALDERVYEETLPESPELETNFKTRSGADCGTHRVKFLKVAPAYLEYLVDNADLESFLRQIASCAAAK